MCYGSCLCLLLLKRPVCILEESYHRFAVACLCKVPFNVELAEHVGVSCIEWLFAFNRHTLHLFVVHPWQSYGCRHLLIASSCDKCYRELQVVGLRCTP